MFEYTPLAPEQFDLFSGYWKVVVNSADYSLASCFLYGAATHVGFSSDQIGSLISTLGAVTIQARFVYRPTTDTTYPNSPLTNFGVVLYAADQCGNRLSAYYLGVATDQIPAVQETNLNLPTSDSDEQYAVQVPHYLASLWMNNWNNARGNKGGGIYPSMFTTASGTLEGYSFPLGDLSQSLFNAQPVPNIEFYTLCNFGLHQTYTAANPNALTYTFGLVLRLYTTNADAKGLVISSEPFYDMSAPRPPH